MHKKTYPIECFLWAGLFSAVSNTILGSIIGDLIFGTIERRQDIKCTIQGIFLITRNMAFSIYMAEFIENVTDKMLSTVCSFDLYKAAIQIYRKLQ